MEKFHTKRAHHDASEEVKEESLCALIQSLRRTTPLKSWTCLSVNSGPTLMDVLLENFTLREINFGNSPIWYSVKKQL